MHARLIAASLSLCVGSIASAGVAGDLYISVTNNLDNELAGLTFTDGDVVRTDTSGSTASIFLSESIFDSTSADVDGFHVLPSGNLLISTLFNTSIGGTAYDDGDVIEYDPISGATSTFFEESTLSGTAVDISALTINATGAFLFSTYADASLGATSWTDGDIVMYNDAANTATVLHTASEIFDDGAGDIYAMHALDDGRYLLSTSSDEMISGTLFRDGDLFAWDPLTDTASLVFSEDNFGGDIDDDIYAAYFEIPAPGAAALFAIAGLATSRRRR